jgi:hypothetical protein
MWGNILKIQIGLVIFGVCLLHGISSADVDENTVFIEVPVSAEQANIPVYNGTVVCGNDEFVQILPDGSDVTLHNNETAKDVTYGELLEFLHGDSTDQIAYTDDVYVCANYALDVHEHAENSGIRAGWCAIEFTDGSLHACNTFNTTDKGLVFIDCTGSDNMELDHHDAIVDMSNGVEYCPVYLFESDYECTPMGIVKDYTIWW